MAESELLNRVRTWLAEQGYPLEMRVAESLAKAGFYVAQSELYSDPETGKLREIDVIASTGILIPKGHRLFDILIVAECKSSKNKPWILFSSARSADQPADRLRNRVESRAAAIALLELSTIAGGRENELLRTPPRVAHGLTRAFENRNDEAYAGVLGVSRGTVSRIETLDRKWNTETWTSTLQIAFPVLVVDGPLLRCELDGSGDPTLEEISRGTLRARGRGQRGADLDIEVVTASEFEVYVEQLWRGARTLLKTVESELPRFHAWLGREIGPSQSDESPESPTGD